MSIEVGRLGKTFFAEVRNVDIAKPLDNRTVEAIRQAQRDHGVFCFGARIWTMSAKKTSPPISEPSN